MNENFKVTKRNGIEVDFDILKIKNAIRKSMRETTLGVDENVIETVSNQIIDKIKNIDTISVNDIQNLVEDSLMESDRKDAAKTYILYRHERDTKRSKKKDNRFRLLSDEFISKYKHIEPPMTDLGNFVYLRTYSRWIEEEGRREYWWETVRRAVEYNCTLVTTSIEEAEELYDNIFNLRQFLSGRTFWVGGTKVAYNFPTGNFNCASETINKFDAFRDLFYLLMVGAGVGVRVLKDDVNKLPKVRTNFKLINEDYSPVPKHMRENNTSLSFLHNDTATITVGDSKEGWVQSLKFFFDLLTLSNYREIKTILINYNNVRAKGEPLKTFGGTASGHNSLKAMFVKINKLIQKQSHESARIKLRPIDCLDIANIIGENVVVGGVRRTAEIVLIDSDDQECIKAKSELYTQVDGKWLINTDLTHRQMSNNSIYYRQKPSREQLHWQLEQMRYSGEPGWVNEEAGAKRRPNMNGVNPCVTGDTLIFTRQGHIRIDSLIGQEVEVWNGFEWSVVTPRITGENQPILSMTFTDGNRLSCTPYHKFILADGTRVEAKDLKGGEKLMKFDFPIIEGKYNYDNKLMYTSGFYCGDGTSNHRLINLYGEKIKLLNYLDYASYRPETFGRVAVVLKDNLDKFFVPTVDYSISSRLSYLAGIMDSDGSITSDGCISIASNHEQYLMELKHLLNTLGVDPKVSLCRDDCFKLMPNGCGGKKEYYCDKNYRLTINATGTVRLRDLGLDTHRLDLTKAQPNREAKPFVQVDWIFNGFSADKVYCFTEPKNHSGIFNGVLTAQCGEILLDSNGLCNLTTLNVMAFVRNDSTLDYERLLRAQRLSVRAGYRMTCIELELSDWNNVQQRDKLLGASLTGWQDMVNITKMSVEDEINLLSELRKVAKEEAKLYANKLGEGIPLLITTVKPEGTLSQLPTVSSGVHYSHSPYFIRRVRINAHDPLVQVCKELDYPLFPEVGQKIETCNTVVVEFPCKSPEGITKYDVSAIQQLENYKMFMKYYVDHNCSITVHVRENEWKDVEQWVWDNWDDTVALSFLSLDDNFYQLMPYEAITKEEYDKRMNVMKPFSTTLLSKYEKHEEELDTGANDCINGFCGIR